MPSPTQNSASPAPAVKPAVHAETQIMEAILDGRWPPGHALPAERILATELGVTRPTLRETLQRLSREGWVTIAHGKPTRVNDYLTCGGLGVLSSMARYGGQLSESMVKSLLEARVILLPAVAGHAFDTDPAALSRFLSSVPENTAKAMAAYDWELQICMVTAAKNPILGLIFNDFTPMYQLWCESYFEDPAARERSLAYYADLAEALAAGRSPAPLVAEMMKEALDAWTH